MIFRTRFHLLARSPNSAGFLLIAAISGRALATAARRAGYRPLVADFFCDTDTVALAERTRMLPGDLQHGIDTSRLVDALRQLAGKDQPAALVLGSGFEREPDIVDEVARHFPLAGNGGAAIRRVKDPQALAEDCAELGIPHPEFCLDVPPDPENWVVKTAGGAGGSHVGRANGTEFRSLVSAAPSTTLRVPLLRKRGRIQAEPHRYFQRFVAGQSVSALFIGDGDGARVIGFSRQWTSPAPGAPYRYGGAVRLRRVEREDSAAIAGWLDGLARRAGLVGLCSADFIRNGDGYHLVEINPRPGATLDIFDSSAAPLMEAHLRAARGEAYAVPSFDDAMASMIAYATAPVANFPDIAWPDWTADHQSPGTRLVAGDPVCTVFARGPNAAATRRTVQTQVKELQRFWEGDAT
jgi:predicted ATP-grasp superfamily ATP-dependent carboligase